VEEFGVVTDTDGNEAYHNGIDIQVPADSEILAAADGEVTAVDQHDDATYWITISHEDDWSTVYGRLGESKVAVGDQVVKGDVLGTPASEILHFSVLESGVEKDPVNFFETEEHM
jgi:murein DD-endopeptidase MepM/ murein hydrolase activator NlpD